MELRPSPHLGVVSIEKGAFGPPSTTVANFTLHVKPVLGFKLFELICQKKSTNHCEQVNRQLISLIFQPEFAPRSIY